MPVTIDATVGGAAANSFVTNAEADTYLGNRLNVSAWTAASEDDQARALIEATRELSALAWVGQRTGGDQALAWPRTQAENFEAAFDASSPYFDDDVIPQWLKDATCELALEFLRAGTTDIAADTTVGVIEKTVDVLTTRWQPGQRPEGLRRFRSVWRLIARYVVGGAVRLVR